MAELPTLFSSSALCDSILDGIGLDEESKAPSSASILPKILTKFQGKDVSQPTAHGTPSSSSKGITRTYSAGSLSTDFCKSGRDGMYRVKAQVEGMSSFSNQHLPHADDLKLSYFQTSPSRKKDHTNPSSPSNQLNKSSYPVQTFNQLITPDDTEALVHGKLQPKLTYTESGGPLLCPLDNTHLSPPIQFKITSEMVPNNPDQLDVNPPFPNRTNSPFAHLHGSHVSAESPTRSWGDLDLEDDLHDTGSGKGEGLTTTSNTMHDVSKPAEKAYSPSTKLNWASVVKGNVEGAMKLSYVKPMSSSKEGKIKIKPPSSVVQKGLSRWQNTLVGFFLDKLPFSLVQNGAYKLWSSKGLVEVLGNGNGFFFFRFSDLESMNGIFENGPWYFGGRPVFLQKWKPGLNLSKAGCKNVPIWVHFHNVPLEYWTDDGLSIIASVVGKPLHADKMTESAKRISYARICIEVGVEDDLPNSFDLELESGEVIEIGIEYNWVPKKCVVCREFGHIAKNCRKVKHQEWVQKKISGRNMEVKDDLSSKDKDGWEEVKRRGKNVVIDKSPSPTKDSVGKEYGTSTSYNSFVALSREDLVVDPGLEKFESANVTELFPSSLMEETIEPNVRKDSFTTPTPLSDGVESDHARNRLVLNRDHAGKGDGVEMSPCLDGDTTPFSESCSVPIHNPLLQKVTMVDEVEKKQKKNRKKDGKRIGSGKGSGKFSSS